MKVLEKSKFRFDKFLKDTIAFLKEYNCPETHPSVWVVWLEDGSPKVQWGPKEGRDNYMQQLNEGKSLFFRFSTECFDEEIHCANSKTYSCVDPQDEDTISIITEIDYLGYLVSIHDDTYQISLAIHSGEMFPYPEQIIVDKVGEYAEAMEEYLMKFITK